MDADSIVDCTLPFTPNKNQTTTMSAFVETLANIPTVLGGAGAI